MAKEYENNWSESNKWPGKKYDIFSGECSSIQQTFTTYFYMYLHKNYKFLTKSALFIRCKS